MKSFKTELKQFLSATLSCVMLMSAIGSGTIDAFADEITPKVVNYPTVVVNAVPVEGIDDYISSGTRKLDSSATSTMSEAVFRGTIQGGIKLLDDSITPIAMIFDTDAVDSEKYDMSSIREVKCSITSDSFADWSDSSRYYNGMLDRKNTYYYIPAINTCFLNLRSVISRYVTDMEHSKNIYSDAAYRSKYNKSTSMTEEELRNQLKSWYETDYNILNDIKSVSIDFTFASGEKLTVPVDFKMNTSRVYAGSYFSTLNSYIAKIPDSTNMNTEDFYKIKNAITVVDSSRAYMSKFYLDMDSEDDVLLPLDAIEGFTSVSKADVGGINVYSNDAAVDMSSYSDIPETPDEATEAVDSFTFVAPIEGIGDVKGSSSVTNSLNFLYDMLLSGYPIVYIDGKPLLVSDVLYNKGFFEAASWDNPEDGTREYAYSDYEEWRPYSSHADESNKDYFTNMLKAIISKGTVPNKIGRLSLADGSPLDYEPGDEFRFHLVVKGDVSVEDVHNQLNEVGKQCEKAYAEGNVNESLQRGYFELEPAGELVSNSNLVVTGTKRRSWDNEWKFDSEAPYKGIKLAGNLVCIDYTAYDYLGFNILVQILEYFGCSIDLEKSYGPDIASIADTGVSVKDVFQVSDFYADIEYDDNKGINDTYYRDCTYPYGDESNMRGRDNGKYVKVEGVSPDNYEVDYSPVTDVASVLSEKSNKAFVNKDSISLPLKELSSLKKGDFYNIVLQMLVTTNPSETVILYNGGDLFTRVFVDHNKISYLQYKYGELALASKPSEVRNIEYDRNSSTIKWVKSEDEGLGLNEDNSAKTDDYIHVDTQKVEIYNSKGELVYENTTDFDGNDNQSLVLPKGTMEDLSVYKVKIYASNAIGTSVSEYTKEVYTDYNVTLTKEADREKYAPVDKVTYTDTVTNTGNVDLTDVTLTENLKGEFAKSKDYTVKGNTATLPKLAVGESYAFTYVVNVADVVNENKVSSQANVVTKEGAEAEAKLVSDVIDPNISVTKSGPVNCKVGDVITFVDIVKNTGEDKLTNVTLTENLDGAFSFVDGRVLSVDGNYDDLETSGNKLVIYELNPGSDCHIEYKVKVTEDMGNKIDSKVVVTCDEGATAEATAIVDVTKSVEIDTPDVPKPGMTVKKVPNKTVYEPDEIVVFIETVTNTGTAELTNVKLVESPEGNYVDVDDKLITGKTEITLKSLKPGESFTYTYEVKAPEDTFKSKLTATCDEGVNAEVEIEVPVEKPLLTVKKTVDKATVDEGYDGELVYTDVVTNTGKTVLNNIVVTEDLKGTFSNGDMGKTIIEKLMPGESFKLTYTVSVKGIAIPNNGIIVSNVTAVVGKVSAVDRAETLVSPVETPDKPTPVETPDKPTPVPEKPTPEPEKPEEPKSPKTGDNSSKMFYFYLSLLTMSVGLAMVSYHKVKEEK